MLKHTWKKVNTSREKMEKAESNVYYKATYCLFTFNQAPFIEEALHSAFCQDYSPLEIVIVDDGSTDGTADIIRRAATEYAGPHKIRLLLKDTNKGLADSVNAAIYELSRGDWLIFAAGDDISSSERVSKVLAVACMDPKLTIIETGATRMSAAGNFLNELQPSRLSVEDSATKSLLGAAAAYNKNALALFPKVGSLVIREDMVLTTRALLVGSFGCINEQLVYWRRHESNISGRTGKSFLERMAFSRGQFVKAHTIALSQQASDVTHAMMQGLVSEENGIRLLLMFTDKIKSNMEMSSFFESLASKEDFHNYFFRHPIRSQYGFLLLILIYIREQIVALRRHK